MNNLGSTLELLLKNDGISKKAYAQSHKIAASDVSRLINQGILSSSVKAVIFTEWPDEIIIALYNAYTRDDIDSLGLTGIIKNVCYNDRDYDLDDN